MQTNSTPGLIDATVGIVCALPKEFSAVRSVLECAADPTSEIASGSRKYAMAKVAANGGGWHTVAIALLPEMGNNSAAIRATNLLHDCPSLKYLLMVGIAGAVPNPGKAESHVRLGDIVVCDRSGVVQYDLVKETREGTIEHRNAPRPPSGRLLELVNWLRSDEDLGKRPWETLISDAIARLGPAWERPLESEDILDDSSACDSAISHPHDPDRRPGHPRVFHGPIAAANVLLKNAEKRDDLRDRFGAKAVEMEGSGVADAAREGQVDYLVIRGTCDYCNSNKNDSWQKYAAVVAAAYARVLISSIPVQLASRPEAAGGVDVEGFSNTPRIHPSNKLLFEKAIEHGRLAGRVVDPSLGLPTQQAEAARMLGGITPPPRAQDQGAFSAPAATDELASRVRTVRAFLDSFDHDRAKEQAADLARVLVERPALGPSSVRKEALELLTDIAIVAFKHARQERLPGANTGEARDFLVGVLNVTGDPSDAWFLATEAYLASLESGAAQGLSLLESRTDPQATRRRLAILVDDTRFAEAADFVRDRPPEREWCEKAVCAFAYVGEIDRAKEMIAWAGRLDTPTLKRRSIICYAESRLLAAFKDRGQDEAVIPGMLQDAEREAVTDVLASLKPILQVVAGNERVADALEEHAVRMALQSSILLGDRPESESLAQLLATRRPIPLALAELILGANLTGPPDLAQKLRDDYRDSYHATRFAFLLEAKDPAKALEAFERALRIDHEMLRKEDRARHFSTLYSLAQGLGEEEIKKVERLAPSLLATDLDSLKLFLADRYLASDRPEVARGILDDIHAEDDPRWLQLYAHLMHQSGEPDAAMKQLLLASKKVPQADLFRQIARIAHGIGRYDVVADVLQKVVALDPTDIRSRINYAGALTKIGDSPSAAEQFRILDEEQPEDPWHALNRAASLAHAGQFEAALAVYEKCCQIPSPRLEAILGRAEVLRLDDRPQEAFDSLEQVKAEWWDQSRFVLSYMSAAYATGDDRQASTALGRLLELQKSDGSSGEILKAMPIDEMKKAFVARGSHEVEVGELLLRGQVPWIMVEEGRGRVPYLGWAIRTQPLRWCPEGSRGRSELSVYSTYGFYLASDEAGRKEVARIECPDRGQAVVADLSALLTLHALDLLEVAADYFGKILVPSLYLDRVMEERSRLQPHQLSQRTSREAVREAIDSRRIRIVTDGPNDDVDRPAVLDEYADDPSDGVILYRALDVLEPLFASGRITREVLDRANLAFSRKPQVQTSRPPLFSKFSADLFTLLTLAQVGCLEPILDSFRVELSRSAEAKISQRLREFRFRENVRTSHGDLWRQVRENARIVLTPVVPPKRLVGVDLDEQSGAALSLGASWIAARDDLPLLVDDRVIQVVMQNETSGAKPVAFGTDRLIERLQEDGAISAERGVEATLRLMRWRYRFVMPSADQLKDLLDRYRENPPGAPLREVAEYVQDCMRDPGLLSGFEPTIPPTSMAARLHQEWIRTVVQFVMKVWDDETWSEASAREVTVWATLQLLPSLPTTMQGAMQGVLARLEHRMVISMALIASSITENPERANAGLRAMAEALGMGAGELYETLADVIAERN